VRQQKLQTAEAELETLRRQKALAQDIAQFTRSARFGDLSPYATSTRIGAARDLFDATLTGARAGNAYQQGNLLGNAQAFLQAAQGAYGSNSDAYAAIFRRVTSALDEFGQAAGQIDTSAKEAEVEALRNTSANTSAMAASLKHIDELLAAWVPAAQAGTVAAAVQPIATAAVITGTAPPPLDAPPPLLQLDPQFRVEQQRQSAAAERMDAKLGALAELLDEERTQTDLHAAAYERITERQEQQQAVLEQLLERLRRGAAP
jgi:phage-related tail protein